MRKGTLHHGDKVEIYRNLHNGTFSVRRDGIVVHHLENHQILRLTNAKFAVQPAGRAKVLVEKKKNVHAFIRGTVDKEGGYLGQAPPHEIFEVYYNPYEFDNFQKENRLEYGGGSRTSVSPIYNAPRVSISHGKVYVN